MTSLSLGGLSVAISMCFFLLALMAERFDMPLWVCLGLAAFGIVIGGSGL